MPKTSIEEYLSISLLRERLETLQSLAWDTPGELTLWIGAGFGKLYANLPVWSELLSSLCKKTPRSDDAALVNSLINSGRLQIAAELLTELQSSSVTEAICELFGSPDFDLTNNPLRNICPGTVITTNYDLMLDHIYDDFSLLDPRQPIESIFSFRPKLVKLHGSIDNPASIVLNVTSYAKAYSKEFEWFLLHVLQNSTVLFVGVGLNQSEPYMRCIKLLKSAGLLHHHHYAIVPFQALGTTEATNKSIRDKGNEYESLGIRLLPYVVEGDADHRFVDTLLRAMAPPTTNASFDRVIRGLDKAIDVFGPDRVGPSVFRCAKIFDERQLAKRPFQNILAKFLRHLREPVRRFELVSTWISQVEEMTELHERITINTFGKSSDNAHQISQLEEVQKNKAFLFDVQRAIRPNKRMQATRLRRVPDP